MGPLQVHKDSGLGDSHAGLGEGARRIRFASPCESEEPAGRHEPQVLVERIIPKDPYAAWLEQRDAERELERESRPQVRWVHRQRGAQPSEIVARRL